MSRLERYFPFIYLITPIAWAGSFIAGKYVVLDLSPVASTVIRFLLSSLLMLPPLALWHRRQHPPFSDPKFLLHLAIVVLVGGAIYHVLFFTALQTISPTETSLIIALNPFFTAFGEVLFLRRKRSGRFYIGFALAMAGALWVNVARGGRIDFGHLEWGHLIAFAAALCWSAYALLTRVTKHESWDSLWINAWGFFLTAIVLLPVAGITLFWSDLANMSTAGWTGTLYMAIFPTAIGYTLFYVAIQKRGPGWASSYIYLVPSFTAVMDHAFFKAMLSLPMIVGTAMVVAGLLIGNLPRKRTVA